VGTSFPARPQLRPHQLTKPLPNWRFEAPTEADFEPLLELRVAVMREHLERVGRFKPSRSRGIFRGHFDEPGMRLIVVDDVRRGCVGFRTFNDCVKIDSFYLDGSLHNSGLGTAILKVLLAEADALRLPIRLEVLNGSKADRFYLRHGFVKLAADEIEGEYERPVPTSRRQEPINPAAT